MKGFRQGVYALSFPEKYIGDASKVVYRSSWELRMMRWLDNNTQVLRWSSEEIAIQYISPLDNKVHRYYPDFYVEYISKDGVVHKDLIEVKPKKQTEAPKPSRGKSRKTLLFEQQTYAVNTAKWAYAMKWCEQRGIAFKIYTEETLFRGK